jgi:hypothetical protein
MWASRPEAVLEIKLQAGHAHKKLGKTKTQAECPPGTNISSNLEHAVVMVGTSSVYCCLAAIMLLLMIKEFKKGTTKINIMLVDLYRKRQA